MHNNAFVLRVCIWYGYQMLVHRHQNADPQPYEVTFETEPYTQFYEQGVVKSAMMLSEFDAGVDRLNLTYDQTTRWAALGFHVTKRNGNTDPLVNTVRFDREELRVFGGLLAYFADNTIDDLYRISANNPHTKDHFGIRRVEAKIALSMVSTIENRIKVPRLWSGHKVKVIGFSR